MNYVLSYIIISVFAVLLLWAIMRIMVASHEEDVILVPRQIAVSEMDDHTPQAVYDWVCYVTKIMGNGYLEQLAYPDDAIHFSLLHDMTHCLGAATHEKLMDSLKEVGYHHGLDITIIDAPY